MADITLKKMTYKIYERKGEPIDQLVFKGHYIEEWFLYNFLYAKIAELNNGHAVGFYVCKRLDDKKDEVSIYTLAVTPKYQRKGVGKLLLKDAITSARRRRFHTISLNVRPSNSRAIKLYKQFGFELEEKTPDKWNYMVLNLNNKNPKK